MRVPLVLMLAACLGAACSKTDQPPSAAASEQATSTPPSPGDPQPAPTGGAQQPASAPAVQSSTLPAEAPSNLAPAPSSNPAPAASSAPAPPPAPKFREVVIPAGTSLSVTVLSTLASNTSKVEDPVKGALAKPIVVSGTTAAPAGAEISGSVIEVNESGRVKGKASIAVRFNRLVVRDETYRIQTARVAREAAQNKAEDAKKGGIGAGVGAIVGGVVGGGKGAAIGAIAGGTGAVVGTKGSEVQMTPGTVVTALLQEPVTVTVPID